MDDVDVAPRSGGDGDARPKPAINKTDKTIKGYLKTLPVDSVVEAPYGTEWRVVSPNSESILVGAANKKY